MNSVCSYGIRTDSSVPKTTDMNIILFLRNTSFTLILVAAATISYGQTTPQLIHFQSEVQGEVIAFNWSVAAPGAVQSFGLERAGADMQFKSVGIVSAQSNQSAEATYRLADQNPLPGVAFYRLKVVNQAGDIAYCKVVSHRIASAVEVGR